ncbi:c-type cytochrome [Flavobacteriaceae bacterium]|jgi:mono/diheme cytochrome c family protein|nr:c-type cytochrome [Flavobacteriaceae bacterium]MDC1492855.1 c-type cytochrome [Flavobacteriaceae bacterium]
MNKKYKKVNSKSYLIKNSIFFPLSAVGKLILSFILIFNISSFGQESDPVKGKALFNSNCAACHKLDKKMTGPALRGVENKLYNDEDLDKDWMYSWIRNSASLIKSGDDYANKIYAEYNGSAMTAFPQLSDSDIDNILAYTAQEKPVPVVKAVEVQTSTGNNSNAISNEIILGAFAFVFLLLAIGLFLVNKTLRSFAAQNNIQLPTKKKSTRKPLWKAFVDNQFLMLCSSVIMLLVSAYFVYGFLMQIGVNQGYEPVQPIHYSHKIHAGDNEIDCKYCHSSARVSKHSGIPSLNVCMNCHKSIYEYNGETTEEYSKEFYDGEIQKLYKAVGWDDESQEYTGETQAVKWVRIHNLPDFAYFNHAQHVSVAGIECQTCHGPVEEMEIMYQYSPLTMGWCINCHRETNVKVKDNQYYEKIHEQLSKKYGVDKLTAAQMGGLECGKCHY